MKNRDRIQEEILDNLEYPVHGLLNIAPRVGKTLLTINILKKEKCKKVLWVTPDRKLRDIGLPGEFKKWKALTLLKNVDIVCYSSLHKIKGKYDKIILDEYQHITINNSKGLIKGSLQYGSIIGLSGTHPKHLEKHEIYSKLNLKILSEMSIDEAVDEKLVAPYKITVIGVKLDNINKNILSGNKTKPFMQTEQQKYDYLTKSISVKFNRGEAIPKFYYLNRMRFIYTLKSKNSLAKEFISKLKGRTLIFSGGIEQAEYLCKHTYHSNTNDEYLKKFLDKKIDKLCCVNSGGTGLTYEGVDNFVIVQVNSNKRGDTTQKIARALLLQSNYKANIYIFYVKDTVDEKWKDEVLKEFSGEIEYIDYEEFDKK